MQKVGVYLNKKEIAQKVITNNGGIAKTADFAAEGMKNNEVAALCKEGFIERIRRGFYQLPHSNQITEEQLIHSPIVSLVAYIGTLTSFKTYGIAPI